ncbi:TetR-like C-terminal domain-containing protein [Nocardia higoensis]|uniref:TetR-like C-terminal domain-containing protein n=1 Tax=Nocardia higoensis TaxID=228599 RepID=UPI0002F88DED|nr:TetR-like C-terminal domain-containing protein [Nocardia higoensis]
MTRPGRPAGPAADTEEIVLTAALDLLLTEGATALTPARLHSVTGVARSTVYRHWPTPRDVLAALIAVAPNPPAQPSGDLAADLHAEVDLLCDRLRDKPVGAFLRALVTASATDPTCTELRLRYVEDLLTPFHAAFHAHGTSDKPYIEEAAMTIVSPLLVDALLLDHAVDRDRAHRAVDQVLARTHHIEENAP